MSLKQHAAEVIRKRLESGEWRPGERLPPLAGLANICGVSRATMWKVVDLLRNESLLHAHKGGAIIAGSAGVPRSSIAGEGLLWHRIKVRIGQEIHLGAFTGANLPPVSKLAVQYGLTRSTIKKALDGLVLEGTLVRHGLRYSRPAKFRSSYQESIALIADAGTISFDPRSREVAVCFERECARLGVSGRLEGFNLHDPKGLLDIRKTLMMIDGLKGCVITLWHPWDQQLKSRWFDLFAFLTGRFIPTVVIDQAGNMPFPATLLSGKTFRVLRISGEKAGMAAAGVLLRRGHRCVAFIAPSLEFDWARKRYTGFCRHVRQFGGGAKVELYTLSPSADATQQLLAVLDIDKEDIRALYGERLSDAETFDLQENWKQVQLRKLVEKIGADKATKTIRYMARSMITLSRQEHDPEVYSLELERLLTTASNKAIELYQRPFFEKILSRSSATAWVFAEEKSALAAVSFLRERGKMVPGDIAVFGFDNWRENIEKQLSTFDFNMNGLVQQALLMIFDEKCMKSRPVISEVDGYLVERRTTRK